MSYLTETSGVFSRKSIRIRQSLETLFKPILIRLHPYATGCLAFRHDRTSKPSDCHHFNGRQGAAFTELGLLRRLRVRAWWMPVEWRVENCHPFQNSTQSMLWGRGSMTPYAFKNVDYDALHFHTFSKYSFWREGGGHKKEFSVYAFDNVDSYGRLLTRPKYCFLAELLHKNIMGTTVVEQLAFSWGSYCLRLTRLRPLLLINPRNIISNIIMILILIMVRNGLSD